MKKKSEEIANSTAAEINKTTTRRTFLTDAARWATGAVLGMFSLHHIFFKKSANQVWQIDPSRCVQCGRCATECVLVQSAVKCTHDFQRCGYCELCFGYFQPSATALTEGAENQLCPAGAIQRRFIEEPYFEYTIDKKLCIGCGKCVKNCGAYGNGSLYLQIDPEYCLSCNECTIARVCPAGAISRYA